MTFLSMTDYLLKSMICGTSVEDQGESLFRTSFLGYELGTSKPEFSAPRFPMRGGINPCGTPMQRDSRQGDWYNGWKNPVGFYHHIEDVDDQMTSYGGIVELLYHEMDFDAVPDFDAWWEARVRPHFEAVLAELYDDYIDEVVNDHMNEALMKDIEDVQNVTSWTGRTVVKDGFVASMKNQMINYFDSIYEPMVRSLHLDTCYAGDEIESRPEPATCEVTSEHRSRVIEEFGQLRGKYFELFDYLVGSRQQLQNPELIALMDEMRTGLYESLQQQLEFMPVGTDRELQHRTLFEAMLIRAGMVSILNDLRKILKSDQYSFLMVNADLIQAAIRADTTLEREEREAMLESVDEQLAERQADFNAGRDRLGHVLVHHQSVPVLDDNGQPILNDGSPVTYRPTMQIAFKAFEILEITSFEIINSLLTRDQLADLEDIDAMIAR